MDTAQTGIAIKRVGVVEAPVAVNILFRLRPLKGQGLRKGALRSGGVVIGLGWVSLQDTGARFVMSRPEPGWVEGHAPVPCVLRVDA